MATQDSNRAFTGLNRTYEIKEPQYNELSVKLDQIAALAGMISENFMNSSNESRCLSLLLCLLEDLDSCLDGDFKLVTNEQLGE